MPKEKSRLAFLCFIFSIAPMVVSILLQPTVTLFGLSSNNAFEIFVFTVLISSFLFYVASIITGIIALRKIRKDNIGGRGWAVAGIIISGLAVLTTLPSVLVYLTR